MPKLSNKIRVPALNDDLVAAILKVKPTAEMPRHRPAKRDKKPKRSK